MKIGVKIFLGFIAVLICAGVALWISLHTANDIIDDIDSVSKLAKIRRQALETNVNFQLAISKAKNYVILRDRVNADESLEYFQQAYKSIKILRETQDDYQKLSGQTADDKNDSIDKIEEQITEVKKKVEPLFNSAKPEDTALQLYTTYLKGVTNQFNEKIEKYISDVDKKVDKTVVAANKENADGTYKAEIIAVLMMLVGLGIAGSLTYIISLPLRRLVDAIDKVSLGDLSSRIESKSNDEVGQISRSTQRMIENLKSLADSAQEISRGNLGIQVKPLSDQDILGSSFKTMVENLRSIIQELVQGAQSLSSSANELVATAAQQSASITEQASSIQEATTTLEEIKAIVTQANEKARSVVQVSDRSLDVSRAGQHSLDQVVDAMSKIKDQVEAIAENILDLSEKTIQIGEITASVNDIAEQSNLLAVNAAIEATKAGEAGKGFGVVAVEVKNLAAQSKEATSQVRSILSEIQKATSSTVMVTEEGSKRVESGVSQVHQVGTNIRQLNDVIVESANAARQIASATNQQASGIEQIAVAMKSINQAANDNVVGARQQNVTAQNLSQLATSINSIVQRYRLN